MRWGCAAALATALSVSSCGATSRAAAPEMAGGSSSSTVPPLTFCSSFHPPDLPGATLVGWQGTTSAGAVNDEARKTLGHDEAPWKSLPNSDVVARCDYVLHVALTDLPTTICLGQPLALPAERTYLVDEQGHWSLDLASTTGGITAMCGSRR